MISTYTQEEKDIIKCVWYPVSVCVIKANWTVQFHIEGFKISMTAHCDTADEAMLIVQVLKQKHALGEIEVKAINLIRQYDNGQEVFTLKYWDEDKKRNNED